MLRTPLLSTPHRYAHWQQPGRLPALCCYSLAAVIVPQRPLNERRCEIFSTAQNGCREVLASERSLVKVVKVKISRGKGSLLPSAITSQPVSLFSRETAQERPLLCGNGNWREGQGNTWSPSTFACICMCMYMPEQSAASGRGRCSRQSVRLPLALNLPESAAASAIANRLRRSPPPVRC